MLESWQSRLLVLLPEVHREAAARDLEVLAQQGIRSRADLIQALQDAATPVVIQRICCWLVGQLRDRELVQPILVLMARTVDEKLTWECGKALGQIQDTSVIPTLANLLLSSAESFRRAAAAHALGSLEEPSAVAALRSALRLSDLAPNVRGMAAEALGLQRSREAVDDLIQCLQDAAPEVRYWSAYALGQIGDQLAMSPLRHVAESDHVTVEPWGTVAECAREALGEIEAEFLQE